MSKYRSHLPQLQGELFLTDGGTRDYADLPARRVALSEAKGA